LGIRSNPIIIGAGHNGLTAAFYLAKAGLEPIVLERAESVGGGAVTGELHPGFRCPTLNHHVAMRSDIAADMQLARRGVEFLTPAVEAFAPALDGPAVVVYGDARRTADALRATYPKDADRYATYRASLDDVCRVLGSLLTNPAPDLDEPDIRDLWHLMKTGRQFRGLGARNAYALLRWAPAPVADFVSEWFESDLLRATLAAGGVSGTMFGPRSAGSALVFLLREATRRLSDGYAHIGGGPGALTGAMADAALAAGAKIQTATPVERITVKDGRIDGVVAGGREIPATAVVSAIDPKTTFLSLIDPADLSPDFLSKIRAYRANGTVTKVNLALSALPGFTAKSGQHVPAEVLSGRVHMGPHVDYLERAFDHAKYGECSDEPWLDVTIPSILDSTLCDGGHVMSIYAHYTPCRLRSGGWSPMKDEVLKRVLSVLERFAPGVGNLVLAAEVITPPELEARFGLHGGHIFHGELALDQFAIMRPLLGYSRYRGPIRGLFMCGAGTHPGGFMSGSSGKLAARELIKGQ
jgi:phytoene dehydrogenase-like protein